MSGTREPVHVRTLPMEAARVAPAEFEVSGHLTDERPRGGGWFVYTCQAWLEGGLLHQRLVAKNLEGLRAMSARRRTG